MMPSITKMSEQTKLNISFPDHQIVKKVVCLVSALAKKISTTDRLVA